MFSDCLKITSNIGGILAEQLLSIYGEIPSGPWALLGSRLDSRFWIPLTLNEMEGMAWIQVLASRTGTFDKHDRRLKLEDSTGQEKYTSTAHD